MVIRVFMISTGASALSRREGIYNSVTRTGVKAAFIHKIVRSLAGSLARSDRNKSAAIYAE